VTIKGPGYDEFVSLSGGPNILSTNGTKWKHARKGVAPAFSSNHIKRMNQICLEQLDHWIDEVLNPLEVSEESFDVAKEMIYLTMRVIAKAGFEYDISNDEVDDFVDALEISSREFVVQNPIHRNLPYLFPEVWRAKRASKRLQTIAFRVMDSFREENKGGTRNGYGDDTIISRIVNNEHYANDTERAADIVIFLFAGHDTTAFSIAWTLIEMARNQNDPQLKEYRKVAANIETGDWRRIDELQLIIREGMRLHPVVATGPFRQIGKAFNFTDDDGSHIHLPKDAIVVLNHYAIFRHKKYYGNDAESFRPGRWKESNSDMEQACFPFSMGARNCVGQALANAEMTTVLSILLAKYEFSIADEGEVDFFITLKPKGTKLIARKLK